MTGFVNGLKKVGKVYHAKFKVGREEIHRSTRCTTREAALVVMRKWQDDAAKRAAGVSVAPKRAPSLKHVLVEWIKEKKGVTGVRWHEQVEEDTLRHMNCLLQCPVNLIDATEVRTMIRTYLTSTTKIQRPGQKKGWTATHSAGGANTQIKILLTLLNFAVEKGWITHIPFKRKQVALKAQEKPPPLLWPEQIPSFMAAAAKSKDEDAMLAIGLELGLGLRESEALGVQIQWIDRIGRRYIPGATKNRRTREVPIPDWLFEKIEDRIRALENPRHGMLIPGPTDQGRTRGYTQKPIRRSGETVGVHDLHPHALRRTFATAHFEAGTPLSQIQQMMGHADPETTMGYIMQRPKDQADAQARVGTAMGLQGPGTVAIEWQPRQPRSKKPSNSKAAS